jgi:uncharacterized protein
MPEKTREFQIFAKPVGARCNLSCRYCYYLKNKNLYNSGKQPLMDEKVLEKYIIQHIEASTDEVIFFSWHGGEPLLAGIGFFRNVVDLQRKYIPSGRKVLNGIQTNGTLLDENWCRFLAEENFIVGISIDGPEKLHNRYRLTSDRRPSFSRVLNGYRLLQRSNIESEILCLVNAENVKHPLDIYRFFKELNVRYITFLPLVERQPDLAAGVSAISVPPRAFGEFLCDIFDEWIGNDIGKVKIQIFEEAIRPSFNQEHTLCIFRGTCGEVPVVEHNGDFYSCDHYVDSEHFVGNIMNGSLSDFLDSEKQQSFGLAKEVTLPQYCVECDVRTMCNGECPKNRFIRTPDGEYGLNYLCEGYKLFFNHSLPFIETIATVWKNQR